MHQIGVDREVFYSYIFLIPSSLFNYYFLRESFMKYTRKLFIYLITIFGLLFQYNPAFSSSATYTNGRLKITALDIGSEYLQVEFRQLDAMNWFILDGQTPTYEPSPSDISTLSPDGRTINVPSITLEGINFSAEFTVIGQAPSPKLLLRNLEPVGNDLGFFDFNEVLDFRGAIGPQGATGPQGLQGATGLQGAVGSQGPAGADTPASHTDIDNNTSVGNLALASDNLFGYANSAFGSRSMENNDTGDENSAFGSSSLYSNYDGSYNSAFGSTSLYNNDRGSQNSAFGSSSLYSNYDGSYNSAFGSISLYRNDLGSYNSAFGFYSLRNNTIGDYNTAIGYKADVSGGLLNNATAIGANALVDASNKVRIGNTTVSVIEGQVAFTSSSDIRLKEQIKPITDGLDFINDLNPVSYHRIGNVNDDMEMGLLAQDVAATLENHGFGDSGMVHQSTQDAYMSLRYNDLLAPMIRAIQELDIQNSMLKQELDRLRLVIENPLAAR